jgi:hypothetical protein
VPRVRGIAAGWWQRLGRVSALVAVLILYGGFVLLRLIAPDGAGHSMAVVLFVLFIVYCVARPHDRWDALGAGLFPGPIFGILDSFGVSDPSWWVKGPLLALVFFLAWGVDLRDDEPTDPDGVAPTIDDA